MDDVITTIRRNLLRWYGHWACFKKGREWMKKCVNYEIGIRPRFRSKKPWRKVVGKDCQIQELGLYKEDAVDRSKWRKLLDIHKDGQ